MSAQLAPRQKEIMELLTQGCSIGQIATRMGIARNTVKTQLGLIRMKLNVHNESRALLVLRYREQYPDPAGDKTPRAADPMSPFTLELGRLLHRLRLLRELSIEDVCTLWSEHELTDLPGETLASYELGIRCPSVEEFCVLCGIFGVFPPNALASVDEPSIEIPTTTGAVASVNSAL